jgi:hypothetical protein
MHPSVRLFANPPTKTVVLGPLDGQSSGALLGKLSLKLSGENGAKTCKAEKVLPVQDTVDGRAQSRFRKLLRIRMGLYESIISHRYLTTQHVWSRNLYCSARFHSTWSLPG